jgi:hypothetical protein
MGFPTATIEFISDPADVFRILETELGQDSQLHRETVFAREHLPIEPEGQLRLGCNAVGKSKPLEALAGPWNGPACSA